MVAVEHGRGSPRGPIWNETAGSFPPTPCFWSARATARRGRALAGRRTSDWAGAALAAVLTAYVRELGRGLGQPADFSGPAAKPHRMALLTLAAVISAFAEPAVWKPGWTMAVGLALISLLAAVTLVRRTLRLAARLAANSGQ